MFNGLVLLVSIVQIRCIIAKHGKSNMVEQKSFIVHGGLFLVYMADCIFWAIWNGASNDALDATVNFHFITHIKSEYENWMRSYYQSLLMFAFCNSLVQAFTCFIFYKLTRKDKERRVSNTSMITEEEVKRLDDTDALHIASIIEKTRGQSTTTADLAEPLKDDEDGVSNNDRRRSMLSETVHSRNRSQDIVVQNALELDRSKLKHRIFAQFLRDS